MVLAGCENKNSRSWIENKISAVDRVYPTKNLYDLFEEFPDGFTVTVNDLYDINDESYSRNIKLIGDPNTKTIKGKVMIILLESEPEYKETIIESSELTYTHSGDFVLANESASAELFPYKEKGFLFQRLTLNKKVLSTFELENASYSWQSEDAYIDYKVQSKTINDYFGLPQTNSVAIKVYAKYDFLEGKEYSLPVIYDVNDIHHSENVRDIMEKDNE